MRVVVLGSRGFVAGGLVRMLEAVDRPCRAVGSRELDLTKPDASARLVSILRPEDALVVCSALTPEHGRDRAAFLKNVAMVDHVATALAAAPCSHVIYISSDSVYRGGREQLDESACCETGDLYGLAHIVREKLLQEACSRLAVPLAILRPGAIYGPGDTHNAYGPNRFIRTALGTGKISLFGEGEEERDHIYIGDVTQGIALCAEKRIDGILNVVTGASPSFRDIALFIRKVLGSRVEIENTPRAVPVVHRRFDNRALRSALPDWNPTPFECGILETIRTIG